MSHSSQSKKFIIIYITYPNLKEAKKVSNILLKERLIACVNYFPIESAYWWPASSKLQPASPSLGGRGERGKIKNSKEIVSIVKTKKANWEKVRKAVGAIHPYEIPCIMKLEVGSNKLY